MATRLKTLQFHLAVGHGETHPHQQSGRLISIKRRRVPGLLVPGGERTRGRMRHRGWTWGDGGLAGV